MSTPRELLRLCAARPPHLGISGQAEAESIPLAEAACASSPYPMPSAPGQHRLYQEIMLRHDRLRRRESE